MHREGILSKDKNLTRDRGRRAYSNHLPPKPFQGWKGSENNGHGHHLWKIIILDTVVAFKHIRAFVGTRGKGKSSLRWEDEKLDI